MSDFRFLLAPVDPIGLVLDDLCDQSQADSIQLLLGNFMRGEKGEKGEDGDPGERGPAGPSGGDTYTHDQSVASTVWNITHNLGRFPSVTVVDSAGTEIEGDVRYVDANHVVVNFAYAFAGRAFLN